MRKPIWLTRTSTATVALANCMRATRLALLPCQPSGFHSRSIATQLSAMLARSAPSAAGKAAS